MPDEAPAGSEYAAEPAEYRSTISEDVFFIEEIDVDPEISLLTMRC